MNPNVPRRLDIAEIAQEASERAGVDFRAGYALTTARRSIELLQLDWANRGLNLWTLDRIDIDLIADEPDYDLPDETLDILDCALHNWEQSVTVASYADRPLARIPTGDWTTITPKFSSGPPSSYMVERTDPMVFHPWPVPDRAGLVKAWRLRYIRPLTGGGAGTLDLPVRFIPAMCSGLAYFLALKSKGESFARVPMLKAMYEEDFDLASQEDRDRANVLLVPDRQWW